jgi:hypothetical protein
MTVTSCAACNRSPRARSRLLWTYFHDIITNSDCTEQLIQRGTGQGGQACDDARRKAAHTIAPTATTHTVIEVNVVAIAHSNRSDISYAPNLVTTYEHVQCSCGIAFCTPCSAEMYSFHLSYRNRRLNPGEGNKRHDWCLAAAAIPFSHPAAVARLVYSSLW